MYCAGLQAQLADLQISSSATITQVSRTDQVALGKG